MIPREGATPIAGTHLLMAVGRRPNTDDLGLEQAGVETDGRGYIVVDDQLRTNVEHIWAMGDCNGRGAFTHTSYNDFEIVAANLLDDDPRRVSDRVTTYALYIDPPLGRAGMTVDQVRASGRKALVGKRPMTRVGRAVEKGETQGFMKVVVDADTEEILGAAILGVGGDEVIHAILDIMTAKKPYTAISRTMHIHPTVSELVPTMLQELKPLERRLTALAARSRRSWPISAMFLVSSIFTHKTVCVTVQPLSASQGNDDVCSSSAGDNPASSCRHWWPIPGCMTPLWPRYPAR